MPNKLRQIDSIDSITQSNSAALELSNKLQTKRKGQSVDLLDVRLATAYNFRPDSGDKSGSSFQDIYMELKYLPFSWLRFDADTNFKHSGLRSDTDYNHFNTVNYNLSFNMGKERFFGVGQRYERKGSNQITYDLTWRLNPKWKISLYNRHEIGHDPDLEQGLRESQLTISRNLHCWDVDLTFNQKKTEGSTVYVIFRLKAFPEMEFGFDQTYSKPESGSQNNP